MDADTAHNLEKRVPWKLKSSNNKLLCEWLFTGDKEFTEPFFDDTINICKRLSENRKEQIINTDLNTITEQSRNTETASPAAIIFHVSRCGSTLLSQLLSCDKRNIVLSEVPFFDELLRLHFKQKDVDFSDIENYLSASIRLYAQKKSIYSKFFFIKTDSWHLHFYETYRKLFPSVPFILLYRNPLEVIESQQKQRGLQAIPGILEPEIFGFSRERNNIADFDAYMGDVLTTYFKKTIEIKAKDTIAFSFNYSEGIPTITRKLYQLLNLSLDANMEEMINKRSLYHAKHPQQVFTEQMKLNKVPSYLEQAFLLFQELDKNKHNNR